MSNSNASTHAVWRRRLLLCDGLRLVCAGALAAALWWAMTRKVPHAAAGWLTAPGAGIATWAKGGGGDQYIFLNSDGLSYRPDRDAKRVGAVPWSYAVVETSEVMTKFHSPGFEWLRAPSEFSTYRLQIRINTAHGSSEHQESVEMFAHKHGLVVGMFATKEEFADKWLDTSRGGFQARGPLQVIEWTDLTVLHALRAISPLALAIGSFCATCFTAWLAYPRTVRSAWRHRRNHCPRCNYPGQPGVCPECGLTDAFPSPQPSPWP